MVSHDFRFIAGDTALDFINTLRISDGLLEHLESFDDLLDWLIEAGLADRAQTRALRAYSGTAKARQALKDARDLRAAIRQSALRVADGKTVAPETLRIVNELLAVSVGHPVLRSQGAQIAQSYSLTLDDPCDALVPIAWAARDLLVFREPSLIKKCKSGDCMLLFYDRSKNHRRSWCSMSSCGNRAKVSAFRKRSR